MKVDTDRLLLTNGGSEAISLVAGIVGGSVVEPEFALHPRGTGPLWKSNPHSPSGILAAPQDRAAVWDEAFFPLATGKWTRSDEKAIVVGSLTKLLACPGLRIGYVLAEPEFIDVCRQRQPTWSLNSLACAALPDLLNGLDLRRDFEAIRLLRDELRSVLESHGLQARPSDANWLLVESPGLRELLAPHGIVVRDCSNFGLVGVARIAVPNESGLARLDEALHHIRDRLALSKGANRSPTTGKESNA
jgi:histidinol-phosphate/aromatic aminotransferase/cobyric acid decarboxylase-like protein